MKISFRPPRTVRGFTKQERGFLSIPPFHGIILAIFKNAKNGHTKTENLFLISCLGVPFCMYSDHSVFSWLQFYKLELLFLVKSSLEIAIEG